MLVCGCTCTHKSVMLCSRLSPTVDGILSQASPLHSQLPRTSLSSPPSGPVPLCTSLAPPTVYFQQLGFGLCHPCTRQPDLPSLCPLTANSAWCPPWQESTKEHQAGLQRLTGALQPQLVVKGLHCRTITYHVSQEENTLNLISNYVCLNNPAQILSCL